jgi:hypothetical protein
MPPAAAKPGAKPEIPPDTQLRDFYAKLSSEWEKEAAEWKKEAAQK